MGSGSQSAARKAVGLRQSSHFTPFNILINITSRAGQGDSLVHSLTVSQSFVLPEKKRLQFFYCDNLIVLLLI